MHQMMEDIIQSVLQPALQGHHEIYMLTAANRIQPKDSVCQPQGCWTDVVFANRQSIKLPAKSCSLIIV